MKSEMHTKQRRGELIPRYFFDKLRSLQNVQFFSRLRKVKIVTEGKYWPFRGLKDEHDAEIGQKGTLCKGLIFVVTILLACASVAEAKEKSVFVGFKMEKGSDSLPDGWKHLTRLGVAENKVSLFREGKRVVLRVKSLNSASSLLKRLDIDPRALPVLVWRWKINRTVGMAIESRKDRNDCTARLRVIFENGGELTTSSPEFEKIAKYFGVKIPEREPPGFKIDYIWGNHARKGEIIDYPGSRNHKVVVVERGNIRANRWIWEKQNLVEDFHRIFRGDPPRLVGIVVLSDTDQTNEGVEACYSSIVLMEPECVESHVNKTRKKEE